MVLGIPGFTLTYIEFVFYLFQKTHTRTGPVGVPYMVPNQRVEKLHHGPKGFNLATSLEVLNDLYC